MRFLDDHLRAEDRVAVVGHDVRLKVYTDFTSDKAQIRRAMNDATMYGLGIRTKNAASSGPSLMRNMDIDRMINHTGYVYEALDLLGDALRPIRARKDVVLFSNGIVGPDEDVRGGVVLNRSRYYDPMIESLNSADVTLYPISLQSGFDVPEFVHQNLASMASDTNGQYFRLHTSYISPLQADREEDGRLLPDQLLHEEAPRRTRIPEGGRGAAQSGVQGERKVGIFIRRLADRRLRWQVAACRQRGHSRLEPHTLARRKLGELPQILGDHRRRLQIAAGDGMVRTHRHQRSIGMPLQRSELHPARRQLAWRGGSPAGPPPARRRRIPTRFNSAVTSHSSGSGGAS